MKKYLDETGIYAYKNWASMGEVVEGPLLERHWFGVTLMYPHAMHARSGRIASININKAVRLSMLRNRVEVPR